MRAALQQSQIHGADGAHAGAGGDASATILQFGNAVLQGANGGIPDARVDESIFLPGEERRAVRGIPECEGGGLVDGNVDRTGGIRLVTRMNEFAVNAQVLGVHELSFSAPWPWSR